MRKCKKCGKELTVGTSSYGRICIDDPAIETSSMNTPAEVARKKAQMSREASEMCRKDPRCVVSQEGSNGGLGFC